MPSPRLIVSLGLDTAPFARALGGVAKTLRRSTRDLGQIGAGLTAGITAPLAGIGIAAGKAAIDWETAFAGVRKTAQGTEEEIAALAPALRKLSTELPTAGGAVGLAQIAESAGRMGIEAPNVLAFTETIVRLVETSTLGAEEAATALSRFANITQLPQKEIGRLATSITVLGSEFATTESEVTEFALRIAAAGKRVGLSEPEITGVAAALSSLGIKAEAGGTAISRVLNELNTAVKGSTKELELFADTAGQSAEEFARSFEEDAAGALVAYIRGLGRLNDAGKDTNRTLAEVSFDNVRIADALQRAAGAGDLLEKTIRRSTEAWTANTALVDLSEKRFQTMGSKLQLASARIQEMTRSVGEALAPAFLELVQGFERTVLPKLQELTQWFQNLSPETRRAIVVVAGLTAALGPLAVSLALVTTTARSLVQLGILAALNPITALIAGLGLAAAGFAAYSIASNAATSATRAFTSEVERADAAQAEAEQRLKKAIELERTLAEERKLANVSLEVGVGGIFTEEQERAFELRKRITELKEEIGDLTVAGAREELQQEALAATYQRTAAALLQSQKVAEGSGNEIDNLTRKIGIHRQRIEEYIAAGLDPQNSLIEESRLAIERYSEQLKALQTVQIDTTSLTEQMNAAVAKTREEVDAATESTALSFDAWTSWFEQMGNKLQIFRDVSFQIFQDFTRGIGHALAQALVFHEDFGKAMAGVFKQLAANVIANLTALLVQITIFSLAKRAIARKDAISSAGTAAAETFGYVYASVTSALPFPANVILAPILAAVAGAAVLAGSLAFLAEGGLVTGPTLAMVGEAGRELVVPLDRVGDVFGGSGTTNVYLEMDGRLLARSVFQHGTEEVRLHLRPGF